MKKAILIVLIAFAGFGLSVAQNQQPIHYWGYAPFPDLPYTVNNIKMDLNIDQQQALLKGAARYQITSRHPELTRIIFDTSDLDVQSISVGESAIDFRIVSDSLIIPLADTLTLGEQTEITIIWESASPYGIHTDVYGNLWTSLNPHARHHWVPLPDHPEVEAVVEVSVTVPADQEAIFNGERLSDEVISTDEKVVRWTTGVAVPVSGISLAVGSFSHSEARSGVTPVSIYASDNTLLTEVRDGLLSSAVSILKEYEQKLSFGFPYESLNIVVLPDHNWEEIQAGAGTIYLYQSLGALSTQLRRNIAAQWFGNYHRYLDATDNKYEFLKTMLAGSSNTEQLLNPDELESINRWNLWERGSDHLENDYLKEVISESLPNIIEQFEGVTGWSEYAAFWYDITGVYWDVLPEFELPEEEQTDEEKYEYKVEYVYDEAQSALTLVFEAQSQPLESLVEVVVTEYGFTDTLSSEITFTGTSDSVPVNISRGIDFLTLKPVNSNVLLLEEKPFLFWIRQLNSENASEQIQAANALQSFTDNPDLQLALRDVLREEENTEVRAALLETLSVLTKDDSGTEETFLQNLNSDELAIRLSGLRALANYEGRENVTFAVRNVIIRAERDTVFRTALETFQQIETTEGLVSLAEALQRRGDNDMRAISVLLKATPADTSNQAITITDRYALGNYPHQVRKEALKILLEYEDNQDYWEQTLDMLAADRDPRIRFQSIEAVKYLSATQRADFLETRLEEELDPRVRAEIRRTAN
jgi:hypothetical protein